MIRNKALLCVLQSFVGLVTIGTYSSLSQSSAPASHHTGKSSTKAALLRPHRLVMGFQKCENAKALFQDQDKLAKLDADAVNEVTAVWQNCANARHNRLYPNDPRVTVVAPVINDPNMKVEIKTVRLHDLNSVRQVCLAAAKAYFFYAEGASTVNPLAKAIVTSVDVVTDSGQTDCNSFIHGAEIENPMVIFTPSIIAGSGVTMRILSMIGAGESAQNVQNAVDKLGSEIKDTAGQTVKDITKNPLIYVTPGITDINVGPVHVPVPTPPPSPIPTPPLKPCVWVPFKGCIVGG